VSENPALRQFLDRIGPDAAASFTPAQCEAIELHFGMRYRVDHAIDWRQRIRLPFAKFYVVLLAGKENRAGA
jgi:hypothetical protein